ncbi:alpha/beta fold hydrolase [Sphingosinicella terrae]|uniref:alpha/beta fold hydrolase n=1 Tax=Sphingosinicella terrae TaxID=2172047 RepID=UPI000E0DBE62|nr:alpha/beta fold hydrolase [Sphingosinicella terrae]
MTPIRTLLGAAAAFLCLAATPAWSAPDDLPRRSFLGIAMAAERQSPGGATVTQVIPGGTAATIGVSEGDVVVRAGDQPIASSDDLVTYASRLDEGVPVTLTVRRGGREMRLSGPAAPRPRESYDGATVDYGVVPWRGGRLRDLLALPEGRPSPPVVFLIQGFTCASAESPSPDHPYRRMGEALLRAGIGYYRVEKPGIGDSRDTPHCSAIDYETELDAFRAAYRHLTEARGVPAERIFLFGHSLGGLQAPMLAAEQPPRGVAVYGTVVRNWADYHWDISVIQNFLTTGADPVEVVRQAETYRDVFRLFYRERRTPAQIAALDPAYATGLRESFNWDGGDNVFGRHFKYDQDLAHQPLVSAWRDARTRVLSLYGESDMVALDDEDHRLIADIVNHYRPGTARYFGIPGTGHGFELIGTREEVRARARTGSPFQPAFNPEVAQAVIDWIGEAMAAAPVPQAAPDRSSASSG